MSEIATVDRLLNEAQRLVQLHGFNGFSYAHLANVLGISKPSIHYHFPSKQDLGLELIRRYRRQLREGFAWVDSNTQDPMARLSLYIQFFAGLVIDGKLCLCAALAADTDLFTDEIRQELQAGLSDKIHWLEKVLQDGQSVGIWQSSQPQLEAQHILAALEGAMLLARAFKDPSRYDQVGLEILRHYKS